MALSARNQLAGKVTSIKLGGVMAEVAVDIGGGTVITSVITRIGGESRHRRRRYYGNRQGDRRAAGDKRPLTQRNEQGRTAMLDDISLTISVVVRDGRDHTSSRSIVIRRVRGWGKGA